jgi:hypothetical protein
VSTCGDEPVLLAASLVILIVSFYAGVLSESNAKMCPSTRSLHLVFSGHRHHLAHSTHCLGAPRYPSTPRPTLYACRATIYSAPNPLPLTLYMPRMLICSLHRPILLACILAALQWQCFPPFDRSLPCRCPQLGRSAACPTTHGPCIELPVYPPLSPSSVLSSYPPLHRVTTEPSLPTIELPSSYPS